MAYPIENIWGYIKPRIKKRDPQTLEELKRFTLEEWNLIPKKLVEKCGQNYVKRLKKIIEISGERLEPYHLNQIGRESKLENKDKNQEKNGEKNSNDNKLKMKIAYNDKNLNLLRKKEIAQLNKEIDNIGKNTRIKLKALSVKTRKIPGIAQYRKKRKKQLKEKRKKNTEEIKKEISSLKKMNIEEYLNYLKKKDQKRNMIDEESTIEESIEKILKIKEMRKEFEIPFEIEF